jgi:hypothetical protein
VRLRSLLARLRRDPLLDAEFVEEFQPGPKVGRRFSPGRFVRLAGVERDAVPWPPKSGATRGASSTVTGTRWRG